jgi:LPXTG-motif cell wall-anchored protein
LASPWPSHTTQRRPAERPWMGMALLLAVPFLSLILIRMLWSGSTLWFLMAGIALLGASAVVFLSRRNEPAYGYQTLAPEPNRLPLVLLGLGVLFIALLILPNFSSGSAPAPRLKTTGSTAQLTHASQPVAQPTAAQQQAQHSQVTLQQPTQTTRAQTPTQSQPSAQSEPPSTASNPPAGSQVYTVQEGDTLWDIAQQFNTTVDDIVSANKLDNASNLQLGQELVIPASSDTGAAAAR